ncbi:MAG TPA: hypothetical protein VGO47_01970 [Chlamydiales bacterium]|nr:hypothetical protein [Chlamydiales bacterium]
MTGAALAPPRSLDRRWRIIIYLLRDTGSAERKKEMHKQFFFG